MIFWWRSREKREADRRFNKGLGCLPQLFTFKILLIGVASLLMLPSTWRYFTQLQPVEITEASQLISQSHDKWVKGSITIDTSEDVMEMKKLRREHLTPVAGTGRAVFYEWSDYKSSPETPGPVLEFNGRIMSADHWMHHDERDRLRREYSDKGIELPEQLWILNSHPPLSTGMVLWRLGVHIFPIFGIIWLVRRYRRALRWQDDSEAMKRDLEERKAKKDTAVDLTRPPGPPS